MQDMSGVADVARGAATAALVVVLVVGAVLLGAATSLADWAWADRGVTTPGESSAAIGPVARPSAKVVGVITLLAVVTLIGAGVLLWLIG